MLTCSGGSGGGSRDPELKKHLEAAKRAASALFSCEQFVALNLLILKFPNFLSHSFEATAKEEKKPMGHRREEDHSSRSPYDPTIQHERGGAETLSL